MWLLWDFAQFNYSITNWVQFVWHCATCISPWTYHKQKSSSFICQSSHIRWTKVFLDWTELALWLNHKFLAWEKMQGIFSGGCWNVLSLDAHLAPASLLECSTGSKPTCMFNMGVILWCQLFFSFGSLSCHVPHAIKVITAYSDWWQLPGLT